VRRLPVPFYFRIETSRPVDLGPHPQQDTGEYTDNMDYGVGSRIRVKLYNGKVVEAEITAITNQSTGRKLQIVYENVTTSVNPAQITEVLSTTQ
jgi:hypothetical protein